VVLAELVALVLISLMDRPEQQIPDRAVAGVVIAKALEAMAALAL
jgi:hypothetical protein